jgi:hypothetical protein
VVGIQAEQDKQTQEEVEVEVHGHNLQAAQVVPAS